MFQLLNFVAYQLAWFACVLGAAHHLASAGAAFAIAVTAVHLALRRGGVRAATGSLCSRDRIPGR
jgi:hypothetical protein